jgi:hypothetical protein
MLLDSLDWKLANSRHERGPKRALGQSSERIGALAAAAIWNNKRVIKGKLHPDGLASLYQERYSTVCEGKREILEWMRFPNAKLV